MRLYLFTRKLDSCPEEYDPSSPLVCVVRAWNELQARTYLETRELASLEDWECVDGPVVEVIAYK